MVRDQDWDVRLLLWNFLETPHMNIEDKLMATDGLINEAKLRKSFDPDADVFVEKNRLESNRNMQIFEYMTILKTK